MSHCPHDLPPGSCADCTPRSRPLPPPDATGYGPWFIADYHGSCRGCGGDIEPGDEIRADGRGGWLGRCCGGDDGPAPVTGTAFTEAAMRASFLDGSR